MLSDLGQNRPAWPSAGRQLVSVMITANAAIIATLRGNIAYSTGVGKGGSSLKGQSLYVSPSQTETFIEYSGAPYSAMDIQFTGGPASVVTVAVNLYDRGK